MTLFFSTELITIARVFLFISTALPHVFVTLMDALSRFNFLFFVILAFKDNSWENTQFFRISLDCFSPSSRAFRRSSSNAADSVTPDWSERSSRALSWNGSALKSSIQRIKSCTACSSFFILLGGIHILLTMAMQIKLFSKLSLFLPHCLHYAWCRKAVYRFVITEVIVVSVSNPDSEWL